MALTVGSKLFSLHINLFCKINHNYYDIYDHESPFGGNIISTTLHFELITNDGLKLSEKLKQVHQIVLKDQLIRST